ncbi:uncharacterized protein BXZ73DRAFT_89050 [Epithele typhae]|uniref:uncharacterized protein n=1 Tax=Epithele typhae TaxID=378194 RepID=UPI002008D6FC|nr:uncharacterized protein BXZ73DRAFT_89050 [Epithele typhae]KAH9939393.1 hypothetical protein BXZ73DRAFT_89050 [Epithele typhae]
MKLLLISLLVLGRVTLAFEKPFIPLNWTTLAACAVDDATRILAGDVTTVSPTNTPAECVSSCAAAGFGYAGVEFGNECHCGTGFDEALVAAPPDGCNMACAGDETLACGGPWGIQVYTFPALRPGAWTYLGCTVDTGAAPAFVDAALQEPFASTLDAVNQCLQACARGGFAFAGVEDAGNCQCSGAGVAAGAAAAAEAECDSLCPLPGDAGFEFCGGVDRLAVYKLTG